MILAMDPLDDIRRAAERIRRLTGWQGTRVDYIVLDHSWSPSLPHVDGHDAQNRRYVLCSPAVLDEVRHARQKPGYDPADPLGVAWMMAVPIYRRENLPDGWPDS